MTFPHDNHYLKNRLEYQISWYNNKSIKYKKIYYIYQSLSIISSALIPVLASITNRFQCTIYMISVLGALTVIIQSILSLTKTKDNWISYRFTSEDLRKEEIEYKNHCGKYINNNPKKNFKKLVETCENIMNNEHNRWLYKNIKKD